MIELSKFFKFTRKVTIGDSIIEPNEVAHVFAYGTIEEFLDKYGDENRPDISTKSLLQKGYMLQVCNTENRYFIGNLTFFGSLL